MVTYGLNEPLFDDDDDDDNSDGDKDDQDHDDDNDGDNDNDNDNDQDNSHSHDASSSSSNNVEPQPGLLSLAATWFTWKKQPPSRPSPKPKSIWTKTSSYGTEPSAPSPPQPSPKPKSILKKTSSYGTEPSLPSPPQPQPSPKPKSILKKTSSYGTEPSLPSPPSQTSPSPKSILTTTSSYGTGRKQDRRGKNQIIFSDVELTPIESDLMDGLTEEDIEKVWGNNGNITSSNSTTAGTHRPPVSVGDIALLDLLTGERQYLVEIGAQCTDSTGERRDETRSSTFLLRQIGPDEETMMSNISFDNMINFAPLPANIRLVYMGGNTYFTAPDWPHSLSCRLVRYDPPWSSSHSSAATNDSVKRPAFGTATSPLSWSQEELNLFLDNAEAWLNLTGVENLPMMPDGFPVPLCIKRLSPSGKWKCVISTKEGLKRDFKDEKVEVLLITYDIICRLSNLPTSQYSDLITNKSTWESMQKKWDLMRQQRRKQIVVAGKSSGESNGDGDEEYKTSQVQRGSKQTSTAPVASSGPEKESVASPSPLTRPQSSSFASSRYELMNPAAASSTETQPNGSSSSPSSYSAASTSPLTRPQSSPSASSSDRSSLVGHWSRLGLSVSEAAQKEDPSGDKENKMTADFDFEKESAEGNVKTKSSNTSIAAVVQGKKVQLRQRQANTTAVKSKSSAKTDKTQTENQRRPSSFTNTSTHNATSRQTKKSSKATRASRLAPVVGTAESPLPVNYVDLEALVKEATDSIRTCPIELPRLPHEFSAPLCIEKLSSPSVKWKWVVRLFAKERMEKRNVRYICNSKNVNVSFYDLTCNSKSVAVLFYDLICCKLKLPTTQYYDLVLKNSKIERKYVRFGDVIRGKDMEIVDVLMGETKERGDDIPAYAIVEVDSKNILTEDSLLLMPAKLKCKLPFDQLELHHDSTKSFDELGREILGNMIGATFDRDAIIIPDDQVDESSGDHYIPTVSLREAEKQAEHQSVSAKYDSAATATDQNIAATHVYAHAASSGPVEEQKKKKKKQQLQRQNPSKRKNDGESCVEIEERPTDDTPHSGWDDGDDGDPKLRIEQNDENLISKQPSSKSPSFAGPGSSTASKMIHNDGSSDIENKIRLDYKDQSSLLSSSKSSKKSTSSHAATLGISNVEPPDALKPHSSTAAVSLSDKENIGSQKKSGDKNIGESTGISKPPSESSKSGDRTIPTAKLTNQPERAAKKQNSGKKKRRNDSTISTSQSNEVGLGRESSPEKKKQKSSNNTVPASKANERKIATAQDSRHDDDDDDFLLGENMDDPTSLTSKSKTTSNSIVNALSNNDNALSKKGTTTVVDDGHLTSALLKANANEVYSAVRATQEFIQGQKKQGKVWILKEVPAEFPVPDAVKEGPWRVVMSGKNSLGKECPYPFRLESKEEAVFAYEMICIKLKVPITQYYDHDPNSFTEEGESQSPSSSPSVVAAKGQPSLRDTKSTAPGLELSPKISSHGRRLSEDGSTVDSEFDNAAQRKQKNGPYDGDDNSQKDRHNPRNDRPHITIITPPEQVQNIVNNNTDFQKAQALGVSRPMAVASALMAHALQNQSEQKSHARSRESQSATANGRNPSHCKNNNTDATNKSSETDVAKELSLKKQPSTSEGDRDRDAVQEADEAKRKETEKAEDCDDDDFPPGDNMDGGDDDLPAPGDFEDRNIDRSTNEDCNSSQQNTSKSVAPGLESSPKKKKPKSSLCRQDHVLLKSQQQQYRVNESIPANCTEEDGRSSKSRSKGCSSPDFDSRNNNASHIEDTSKPQSVVDIDNDHQNPRKKQKTSANKDASQHSSVLILPEVDDDAKMNDAETTEDESRSLSSSSSARAAKGQRSSSRWVDDKRVEVSKESSPPTNNKVDDATTNNRGDELAPTTQPTETNEAEDVDQGSHNDDDFPVGDNDDDDDARMNEAEDADRGSRDDDDSDSPAGDNVDGEDDADDGISFRSSKYAGKKCFDDDTSPTPVYFNGLQFQDTLTNGIDIAPDVMNGLVKLLQLNIAHIYKNEKIIIINDPTFGATPQASEDEEPIPLVPLEASSKDGNRQAFQAIFIEKNGRVCRLGKLHGEKSVGHWVLAIFEERQSHVTFHHWSPGSRSIFADHGKQLLQTYIQRTVHQLGFMGDPAQDDHVRVIWPEACQEGSPDAATLQGGNDFHVSESFDTEPAFLTYDGSAAKEEDSNRSGVVVLKELIHRCFLITGRPECQGHTRNDGYATGEYMNYKPSSVSSEKWLEQLSLDATVADLGSETNGFKPRNNANDREYIVKWFAVYFRRLLPTGVLALPENVFGTEARRMLELQIKAVIAFSRIELVADSSSDSSMSAMDKLLDAIKFSMAHALAPECCIQQDQRLMTCLDCGQISHCHHFSTVYGSMEMDRGGPTCQYCDTGKRWMVLDQWFKTLREIEFPVATESDTETLDSISQQRLQIMSSLKTNLTQNQRRAKRRALAIQRNIKAGDKSPSSSPSKDEFKGDRTESEILPLELDDSSEGDKRKPLQRFKEAFIEQTVAGACPILRVEAAKTMGFRSSCSSATSCMPDSLENIISCMMTENEKDCLPLPNGRSITVSTLGNYLRSELHSCAGADDDAMYCSPDRMISVLNSMGINVEPQKDGSKKALLKEKSNCMAILNLPSNSVKGKVYTHCIAWLPSHRLLIDNSEDELLQLDESVIQALTTPLAGIPVQDANKKDIEKKIHREIAKEIFSKLVGGTNISIRAWYKFSLEGDPVKTGPTKMNEKNTSSSAKPADSTLNESSKNQKSSTYSHMMDNSEINETETAEDSSHNDYDFPAGENMDGDGNDAEDLHAAGDEGQSFETAGDSDGRNVEGIADEEEQEEDDLDDDDDSIVSMGIGARLRLVGRFGSKVGRSDYVEENLNPRTRRRAERELARLKEMEGGAKTPESLKTKPEAPNPLTSRRLFEKSQFEGNCDDSVREVCEGAMEAKPESVRPSQFDTFDESELEAICHGAIQEVYGGLTNLELDVLHSSQFDTFVESQFAPFDESELKAICDGAIQDVCGGFTNMKVEPPEEPTNRRDDHIG